MGLILVLLSWAGGTYLIRKWRGTKSMSISQHGASSPEAYRLLMAILILLGISFYIWLVACFAPHLGLGASFIAVLTVAIALQIVAGLVPDSDGWKSQVHQGAAYAMAWLYFPLSLMILASSEISQTAKIVGIACLAYMITATVLFFFAKKARSYYLIFQSLYIVAFQLIILSTAYL